jgi:hypothetical protein
MQTTVHRQLLRRVLISVSIIVLSSPVTAQFSRGKLESLRNELKLLELTRPDVVALLSPNSFSSWDRNNSQTFYREDETIDVFYSKGKCEPSDFEFIPLDAWNVPKDTLVSIEIEPKDKLTARELGIDLGKLRKERPFRDHKNYLVYFDKDLGVAVYLWGDTVSTIRFFPSRSVEGKLCDSDAIGKYFRSNKWRFAPQPKPQIVDFNFPAKVLDIQLVRDDSRTVSVNVKAKDPENDVLTYNYKVSAGRIVGTGANVKWDLSGVASGSYSITAAVDDGIGLRGRYITKSITID